MAEHGERVAKPDAMTGGEDMIDCHVARSRRRPSGRERPWPAGGIGVRAYEARGDLVHVQVEDDVLGAYRSRPAHPRHLAHLREVGLGHAAAFGEQAAGPRREYGELSAG